MKGIDDMSNFAILNMQNRTTLQSVSHIQDENKRKNQYEDIDTSKSSLNKYDDFKNFRKMYNDQMKTKYYAAPDEYGRKHKEPKIKCIDMVLTFSPEMKEKINIDEWYQKNKEFIQKRFSECPFSMVLHQDQTTPHIHVQILPVTPQGKISKNYFVKGRQDMHDLQSEYAKAMECFGLIRGEYRESNKKNHMKKTELSKLQDMEGRISAEYREMDLQRQFNEKEIQDMEDKQKTLKRENRALKDENFKLNAENKELKSSYMDLIAYHTKELENNPYVKIIINEKEELKNKYQEMKDIAENLKNEYINTLDYIINKNNISTETKKLYDILFQRVEEELQREDIQQQEKQITNDEITL